MCAVYDDGIEMPLAGIDVQSGKRGTPYAHSRFKNLTAPSKHSGLNSLSPNEPRSSVIRISTFSGNSRLLMSPKWSWTCSPHSAFRLSCNLAKVKDLTDR